MASTTRHLNSDKVDPLCQSGLYNRTRIRRSGSPRRWLARAMACLGLVPGWSVAAPRLAAQQSGNGAHVSGVVRTAAGAPVGGVAVQLAGTSYRGITSDSGTFDLVAVAPGTYTLVARGPARAGARVRVTVVAGEDTKVDLVMVAAGAAPTSASGAETLAEVKVEGQRGETAPSGPGVSDAGSN
jgi:hypothetical protein